MLTVTIYSFSFFEGIPTCSENGGGHVFDCRALHNPGRYEEYKQLCGLDQPVIDFLKKEPEVDRFLELTRTIVCQSIDCYLKRDFSKLMVSYGCTGGQHRSVYCAQSLGDFLREEYPQIRVEIIHREQLKREKK